MRRAHSSRNGVLFCRKCATNSRSKSSFRWPAGLMLGWAVSETLAQQSTNTLKSLTVRECIEQALANNLDIRVERINPSIAQWGIVREQGAFEPALGATINYADALSQFSPT